MLVQATTPRPLFNPSEYPEYVRIHALRKAGVSKGVVFFSMTTSVEHGDRMTAPLDPLVEYDIDGEEGFALVEYVLPFDKIYGAVGRDITTALLGAGGYHVTVHSAYRIDSRTYQERVLSFQLLLPVTGGGIVRVGDSHIDIANKTLDPRAPTPSAIKDMGLALAVNRTHAIAKNASAIEKRREERLKAARAAEKNAVRHLTEASEVVAENSKEVLALPEHVEVKEED